MVNIFEKSAQLLKNLNNPNKNYWEQDTVSWDRAAKAPDGSTFNEQQMMESIRESDIKRLLKFG